MKARILLMATIIMSLVACENQENVFDDFGSTSVYFPYQTPVRTLIQGKYDLGYNENDNNGRFEIGVIMSGVYKNDMDRKVHFELAPELINKDTLGVDSINVKILPASYYTIEQESPVTIPAGSTKGRIPVQLNDAFFEDSLAFAEFGEVHYVIPLKITDYEGLDSLLTGVKKEDVVKAKKVVADDWQTLPKDYTLFGVKYMNKYQGKYLVRGEDRAVGTLDSLTTSTGVTETIDIDGSTIYRADYVVEDEIGTLLTSGSNKVLYSRLVKRPGSATSKTVAMELTFDDNGDISVTNPDNDEDDNNKITSGSGKWVVDGDEWGGEKRNVIHLEYEYKDSLVVANLLFGYTNTYVTEHTVNDTLVVRDRDVKFEEFTLVLEE